MDSLYVFLNLEYVISFHGRSFQPIITIKVFSSSALSLSSTCFWDSCIRMGVMLALQRSHRILSYSYSLKQFFCISPLIYFFLFSSSVSISYVYNMIFSHFVTQVSDHLTTLTLIIIILMHFHFFQDLKPFMCIF